jgi:hypothetical protein
VLAHQTGTAPADLILTGLLSGAIVLIFGWLLPTRKSKGVRTLAKVLGFREFLRRVEKDLSDAMSQLQNALNQKGIGAGVAGQPPGSHAILLTLPVCTSKEH